MKSVNACWIQRSAFVTDKIIVVAGSTGAQGGGLVRAILADRGHGFSVRAITRNINSHKARELARLGADVVAADIDDARGLRKALQGAYGAYFVTFFWEHMSPRKEKEQVRIFAGEAKLAGLKHAIWSTLEDTRRWVPVSDDRMPTLMGHYKVPHFDAKGESDRVFTDLGVPTTFLLTSFYWDNLIHFGMGPKRGVDGKLAFALPLGEKKLPGIAAEDIGRCAYGIFKQGQVLIGKTVGIAGEHLTGEQMCTELAIALGQGVRYDPLSPEAYRRLGFPGSDDLGNMFQFQHDFQEYFCGARNIGLARSLNPALHSFREWLEKNEERIPLE